MWRRQWMELSFHMFSSSALRKLELGKCRAVLLNTDHASERRVAPLVLGAPACARRRAAQGVNAAVTAVRRRSRPVATVRRQRRRRVDCTITVQLCRPYSTRTASMPHLVHHPVPYAPEPLRRTPTGAYQRRRGDDPPPPCPTGRLACSLRWPCLSPPPLPLPPALCVVNYPLRHLTARRVPLPVAPPLSSYS